MKNFASPTSIILSLSFEAFPSVTAITHRNPRIESLAIEGSLFFLTLEKARTKQRRHPHSRAQTLVDENRRRAAESLVAAVDSTDLIGSDSLANSPCGRSAHLFIAVSTGLGGV